MDRTLNKIYKFTRGGDQHFKKYVMEQARPRIGEGGRSVPPPPPLGTGMRKLQRWNICFLFAAISDHYVGCCSSWTPPSCATVTTLVVAAARLRHVAPVLRRRLLLLLDCVTWRQC